jgi:tRNA threonylcarbamoyladenosine biosynthesis protein TsaE
VNDRLEIITHSPEGTIKVASDLAEKLEKGSIIALTGELGAGKTVFVKGLAKGLGIADYDYVNSPTFVIVKEYTGKIDLYHFDVYRLEEQNFCDTLDYRRYFYGNGITVIEWADKIIDELPEEYMEVKIEHKGERQRKISFQGIGHRYDEILEKIKAEGIRLKTGG